MSLKLRARSWAARVAIALGGAALVVPLVSVPATAAGTGTIAVCLIDSTGASIIPNGDQAWWQQGSSHYVGAVGPSGCRESTIPIGNVTVWVGKDGTFSDHRTVTVNENQTTRVDFYTTKVTVRYAGSVAFGGPSGDRAWFKGGAADASKELLSNGTNPTMFRMSSSAGFVRTPVSWPIATGTGKSTYVTLMAMQVKKNDGTGLAGVKADYKPGMYTYHAPGSTDSNGLLGWAYQHPMGLAQGVDVTAFSNGTRQTKSFDSRTDNLFKFQTTQLTVHYNDTMMFYYSGYASNWNGSPMEVFPGTYPIKFRSWVPQESPAGAYAQTSITVPDPASGPVEKTAVVVRFHSSTGAGLVGSVAYYRSGWNYPGVSTNMRTDWNTPGATPLNTPGAGVFLMDGAPTNIAVALFYNGQHQQLANQNPQTKPLAYFKTGNVDVKLVDSHNAGLAGGSASYYANGWHSIGTTDSSGVLSLEMLPGSYAFSMSYAGTSEQLNGQPVTLPSSTITFQTGPVYDSTGGSVSSYYANGWRTFHDGMELLAGQYWFGFNDATPQAKFTLNGHGVESWVPPLLGS